MELEPVSDRNWRHRATVGATIRQYTACFGVTVSKELHTAVPTKKKYRLTELVLSEVLYPFCGISLRHGMNPDRGPPDCDTDSEAN